MFVALTSVKGSPGVTTFAVALAAQWPAARRLVVECDPAGGDLAQRFGLAPSPGLLSLAAIRSPAEPDLVWNHAQSLPGGARVIAGPPGGPQARAALSVLTTEGSPLFRLGRGPDAMVFADCGRLDPGSPAEPVIRQADALLLISGTYGDELAHLAVRAHELGSMANRPSLVLAGEGYPTGEVERELRIPVMARIPNDPSGAAALTGHAAAGRRSRGGLVRAAAVVARALTGAQAESSPRCAESGPPVPGAPAQQVCAPGVSSAVPGMYRAPSLPGEETSS